MKELTAGSMAAGIKPSGGRRWHAGEVRPLGPRPGHSMLCPSPGASCHVFRSSQMRQITCACNLSVLDTVLTARPALTCPFRATPLPNTLRTLQACPPHATRLGLLRTCAALLLLLLGSAPLLASAQDGPLTLSGAHWAAAAVCWYSWLACMRQPEGGHSMHGMDGRAGPPPPSQPRRAPRLAAAPAGTALVVSVTQRDGTSQR